MTLNWPFQSVMKRNFKKLIKILYGTLNNYFILNLLINCGWKENWKSELNFAMTFNWNFEFYILL